MNQDTQFATQNTNDIRVAVQHAQEMLQHKAYIPAEQQGLEILKLFPNEPNGLFILGCALRGQGRLEEAKKTLKNLVNNTDNFALALQELAFTYHQLNQMKLAIDCLQQAVNIQPQLALSWKMLSELLNAISDKQGAMIAFNKYQQLSASSPKLNEALQAFIAGKYQITENICREHLKKHPNDVSAIRLLAEVAIKVGIYSDAEQLLVRCLKLAPDYHLARLNYAHTLNKREKCQEALEQIVILEASDAEENPCKIVKAAILVRLGRFNEAIALYDYLIQNDLKQSALFTSRGHALKTIGQQDKAIASYRQAIECDMSHGEAYWSLANLKTFTFLSKDITVMKNELAKEALAKEDRVNICFALGKAFEDKKNYKESFKYYQQGNEIQKKREHYNAAETTELANRMINSCTASLFERYKEQGCLAADPIFIVGLPRSGSTLLEQILSSHSQVDGTKELPDILSMVRRLGDRQKRNQSSKYPEIIQSLSGQQLKELGYEYLQRTQIQRRDAPFFIDKMPNNFMHIGFIKKILPNAKIIDARRHAISTCFSGFKQLFATGQAFTYDLDDLGQYYLDYVNVMSQWHQLFPGEIITMQYENVIADFDNQVKRLLDFCGLPFEQTCIEFYNNKRPVVTASSEQVRQPINQKGLGAWKPFEEFLIPLKTKLSSVL
ncbi:MAG: sulfotransferase [Paraglaciecola sp.]|nr:sulfotransferase [Paraglaciecola sp.]